MLVYFKVGNYKSVKDPILINFNAASITEHPESNVLNENGVNLVRSILLYGHNASGKSKILDAFEFFRRWVLRSIDESLGDEHPPEPFALNEATEKQPSFFEACFLLNEAKYRYGFEMDKHGVQNEWLLEAKTPGGKDFPVFLRIEDKFDIDYKRFKNAEDLNTKTRNNALFLTVASQWNVQKAIDIVKWFKNIQIIHGLSDSRFPEATIDFLKNKQSASLIKELVKQVDLGIDDIQIQETAIEEERQKIKTKDGSIISFGRVKRPPSIYTTHTKFNVKNEPIGTSNFLLNNQESEGTIKYFKIIGQLLFAIQNDHLVIIDEFDARLHTLLSKAIIRLFNSSLSKSKAQLFIVSHDTALLDNRLLRRDQIYFVSKNKYGATEVTALVEYKTRKESPYDKNYLEGKYGAIPFIEEFESILKDV